MRSSFWDKWKGGAIIAVVLIHASGTTASFPLGSFNNEFGIVLRQFINFPVGLFIFLAAFFVGRSQRSPERYWVSVRRRVWRLALPYLIWSAIYCVLRIGRGSITPEDVPLMILNGTLVSVGYFVIVMIQLSILSPALERLDDVRLTKLLPISLLFSLAFTYSVKLIFTESIWSSFPYYALPFFVWLPLYIGGLLVGRKAEHFWKDTSIWKPVGVYFLFVGLSLMEAELMLHGERELATSQLKLTSILVTSSVCMIAVAAWGRGEISGSNALSWLGRRSYYFYLSHMLILSLTQKIVGRISVLYENQMIFVFLLTFLTLGICSLGGHPAG